MTTLPLEIATLVVDVPGTPVPQGSLIPVRRGSKIVLVSDNPALKRWRADVARVVRARMSLCGWTIADCPVRVELTFLMPRPATVPKRARPHVRPDIDKLARAILDSLTGTAILDDARVVTLVAAKHYAEQPSGVGVRIRIEAL